MKTCLLMVTAIALISVATLASSQTPSSKPAMPPGMKGDYETIEGKILKVFRADDKGARFRAYLVRWKDFEVVVSDPLGTTDKKEGDMITFMAQRLEMPFGAQKVSILHFLIMDMGAFRKR
ncbi:MAG: hypothetical protein A2V83_02660 [Nitrospirae bacterium RBG_16_64_22]|nr:MAG: hypothetical protein A2V83_02660 [Nitrospirae bacterium RBG_16_64_22]